MVPGVVIESTHSCPLLSSVPEPSIVTHIKSFPHVLSLSSVQFQQALNMTVKLNSLSGKQSNPWVETPLRESYALSEAAGWYGHTSSTLAIQHYRSDTRSSVS